MRVAAQVKYYGSPTKEEAGNKHILMETDNWKKVDPKRQARHNNTILDIMNTGNSKLLAVRLFGFVQSIIIKLFVLFPGLASCGAQNCLLDPPAQGAPRILQQPQATGNYSRSQQDILWKVLQTESDYRGGGLKVKEIGV